MRWQAKEDINKFYAPGEIKVVKLFPLLPQKIGGSWWWLEPVYVKYKCIPKWETLYHNAYTKMMAGKDYDPSDIKDSCIRWTYIGSYSQAEYFLENI